MSNAIIQVENLGKRYRIKHQREPQRYTALRDVITEKFKSVLRTRHSSPITRPSTEDFWALKDVSFEVKRGEVLGIIGRNGAGKSTLLKILSRITEPTQGRVRIKGRVASLLEVGTGFHPELSGRENVFLNGAILGMSRVEIRQKFDEIVAFAGVEKFLDTPVKRYSSGMYVRLAFAVAAHLEPEILIVDEVLAVGDAAFQKKCLGTMRDVAKGGRTVLFVSHNMTAVRSLCSQGILLQAGKLRFSSTADDCIRTYLRNGEDMPSKVCWNVPREAPGNETVRLLSVAARALREDGESDDLFDLQTPVNVEIEYEVLKTTAKLHVTLVFYTDEGAIAFTSGSTSGKNWDDHARKPGHHRSVCHIPANLLNEGTFTVLLLVVEDKCRIVLSVPEVIRFEIKDLSPREVGAWHGREPGPVRPKLEWSNALLPR